MEAIAEVKKETKIGWLTTGKERRSYYFGYAGFGLMSNIVQGSLSTFLLLSGINLSVIAIIIFAMKFIDAVDDVIFGFLVDRVKFTNKGRLGKWLSKGIYLPFIKVFVLALPLAGIFLYRMPLSMSDPLKVLWFCLGYLLFDISYTAVDLPVNAMITTITDNQEERTRIIAYRYYPLILIGLLVSVMSTVLISEKVGVPIGLVVPAMLIFVIPSVIPILFNVKEHNPRQIKEAGSDKKYTFRDMLQYLKSNKYLTILVSGSLILGVFSTGSSVSIFSSYYLFHSATFALVYTAATFVPMMLVPITIAALAKKHDKFRTGITFASIAVVMGAIIYFVGYSNPVLHVALVVLAAIPVLLPVAAFAFLIPNCVEYGKYKSGIDGVGITFAINSFTSKVVTAFSAALATFALGRFGWVAIKATSFADLQARNITQSDLALKGLWFVNWAIPTFGVLLGVLVWSQYKLRDKDVDVMIRANKGEITHEEAEALMSRKY